MFAIHFDAGRDPNGNPKRVYVIFSPDGEMIDAIDEGYQGHGAIESAGYKKNIKIVSPRFPTDKTTYRELVKWGREESPGAGRRIDVRLERSRRKLGSGRGRG